VELQVSTPLFEHVLALGAHEPTHTPVTQVWPEHATAPPYWPSDPQVWTPLPEHFAVPGMQTPPQAPLTQAYWHPVAAPHAPVESQIWTPFAKPPSPTAPHCVLPGAQTPWHDAVVPVVTHAWLLQATALPHWPAEQDWTELPEHWDVPAVQVPVHCPAEHAPLAHGRVVPQLPLASHVCTPVPMHWTAPGVHAPPQAAPDEVTTHA
jgi:hypothetical protein